MMARSGSSAATSCTNVSETWANIGTIVTGLGAVTFCAGLIAYAAFAWYATNVDAISASSGSAPDELRREPSGTHPGPPDRRLHTTTLGSVLLMVARWRARSVPRWLPLGYLVLTVGLFVLRGDALSVLQAVQTLSLLAVAFFTLRAAGRNRRRL